jgi:hypothetical protein
MSLPRFHACLLLSLCLAPTALPAIAQERSKDAAAAEIPAPELPDGEAVIALPEPFHQFCMGGAGRYLIFHLKEAKKLAIFDVSATDVVHEITLPGEDVLFAAGREKLVIVLPGQNLMHRYNLADFQREQSTTLGNSPPIRKAVMGCSSQGPLCLWADKQVVLVDVEQLKPIPVQGPLLGADARYGLGLRVSADGQTFAGWTEGISGQRYNIMRFFGRSVGAVESPDDHTFNGHWAQPSADGSLVFRYGGGIYTGAMKPISTKDFEGAVLIPSTDPRYFLAARQDGKDMSSISICTTADRREILQIGQLDSITSGTLHTEWGYHNGKPRANYLPSAKALVVLPDGNDRVVLRRLDLLQELADRGEDYLLVTSAPVTQAVARRPYEYQIEVASSAGGVTYGLESGPKGLTVSDAGLVSWRSAAAPSSVMVSIRDKAGNEIFHAFDIVLTAAPVRTAKSPASRSTLPPRPKPTTTADAPSTPAPASPATTSEPTLAPAPSVEIGDDYLELAAGDYSISPGLHHRTLLLTQGNQLTVLGADGLTVEKTIPLDKPYVDFKERADYYVGVSNEPAAITLLDKRTHKPLKTFPLAGCHGVTDLALHPHLPISYVAYKSDFEAPRYKFIMYNEDANEGREDRAWVGTWIRVSPDAKWMIVGYRDLWGTSTNVDELKRYSIDPSGMPDDWNDERKDDVGGNGKGLRMSRDGKRVTYLSFVGYPEFSRNLAGWDPTDLGKIPVTYATKDRASTQEMVYHPTLPLVASPSENSAVFFHRETGALEENRLQLPEGGLIGETVERLYFSPDGRNLIFQVSINGIRYLHRVPLRLTAQEQSVAASGKEVTAPSSAASPAAAMRTWTDNTGRYSVRAQLLGVAESAVKLGREDGREIGIPLNRLSAADQEFVKSAATKPTAATAAAGGWTTFVAPEGFRADFPAKPMKETQKDEETGIETIIYAIGSEETQVGFAVTLVRLGDLAAALDRAELLESVLAEFQDGLVSRKPITLGEHTGIEAVANIDEEGTTIVTTMRLFAVGSDIYQVTAGAPAEQKKSAEITRFLDSFRLGE